MFNWIKNLKVITKIQIGFSIVALIMIGIVTTTLSQTKEVKTISDKVIEIRVPTAQNSLMMLNGINHSLAALRGWMILGNEKFKIEREKSWSEEINPSLKKMEEYSKNWTNPKNIEKLKIIQSKLKDFKQYQSEIESISGTIDNLPANKILLQEAAPQAAILVTNITKIINIEGTLESTPKRKALLGMMADVRGTTARSLANIRAYLLSGDSKFKDAFDVMWRKNIRRFGDLTANKSLLTTEQAALFKEFTQARETFAPLPEKMFKIRGSNEWNIANTWLRTKAAPSAFAIKEQLDSMTTNQKKLLATDMDNAKSLSDALSENLWTLLSIGLGLTLLFTIIIVRAVKVPIEEADRVRAMVENAPLNFMFADIKNLNLQYLNPASIRTLKTIEQYLPVPVDELLGKSIDIFHKNPAHQRKILADPGNMPYDAQFQLGPETLELQASAIFDSSGKYIGPMISWSVITDKIAMQTKTAQVMSMMENMPTNVIYADDDLNVQYMNPASNKTLKTIEQYLPTPVDNIIGQSIDIFHQNPALQRKILGDPKNLPHQAIIQLGPEKLDLLVSAIYDDNHKYLGPMVSWSVVTEKLALETKAAQVTSMMENAPTNVIYADTDLNIQYMNPASTKTLTTIEQYLPTQVDKIMGQSIDIFHKNPAMQRKILEDPRNLPHQAVIQLGPEKLDLLVSAIYDNNQNYMGPMISWSLVTKQLELEERDRSNKQNMFAVLEQIGEVVQGLAEASEELSEISLSMEKNAENAAKEAGLVSESGKEVSSNVNSVAAGTEEMNASIKEIAGNASNAADTSLSAVKSAKEANAIISSLGQSSQEIGEVIKVINSIAEQTNLLALNATIEAARAGEAGKGFAVVANEVKELANQTAKATGEITEKIQSIQSDVGGAVTSISDVGKVIDEINGISTTIASAVEEQTATTGEMTRNVSDAAGGSQTIAENLASLATAVDSTKQGAGDTQIASSNLSKMAEELRTLIENLKNDNNNN